MLAFLLACAAPPAEEPPIDSASPVDIVIEEGMDGDGYGPSLDCDDTDSSVHPGAEERCNGIDDDCDGEIDEDVPERETCNGEDDDCDGEVDEGFAEDWYADADGDGQGDPAAPEQRCSGVDNADDCDDGDRWVYPGSAEMCDDVDQDCAGDGDGTACDAPDCADGTAMVWVYSGRADLTELATVGTADAPADLILAGPGTLWVCPGTWHVAVTFTGPAVVQAAEAGAILASGAPILETDGPWLWVRDLSLTSTDLAVSALGDAGITLDRCVVTGTGGAVLADEGAILARESTFTDNQAPGGGLAAPLATGSGPITVEDCVFADNEVGTDTEGWACGGALSTLEGDLAIVRTTFSRNTGPDGAYAGAACSFRGAASVSGSTFEENAAGLAGGLWLGAGALICADTAWSGNTPTDIVLGTTSRTGAEACP